MTGQRPLVVVSHRPPVLAVGDGWQRAPGGLVSALEPALRGRPARWFAHEERSTPPTTVGPVELWGLPLRDAERRNAIDGFCNRTLWPALHGIISNVEQLPDWYHSFQQRSAKTARRLAQTAEPGATVWLHDYHMFGVAQPLAALRPDVRIGLFCHTPIHHDTMSLVANIDDLVRSLGACHFIGTQTADDRDQLRALIDGSGTTVPPIEAVPVAIDHERWVAFRRDPVVRALAARHARPRGLLAVGVDRADYTKGLTHKLLAIELLLDSGVIDADDFRLVQVAVPSRVEVPTYAFLLDQLREIADRINRQFPRTDGIPVVEMLWSQLSPRELAGLMRAADLALVTPVRDGMNMVALEFSVLNGDRPCEVILGNATGAATVIGRWCSTVDGSDVLAIAGALRTIVGRAADPTDARSEWQWRSAQRADAASRRSSAEWASQFLGHLESPMPAAPLARSAGVRPVVVNSRLSDSAVRR